MSLMGVIFGLAGLVFVVWYVRDGVRNAERNRLLNKLKTLPVRRFPLLGQMWYFIGPMQRTLRLLYEALAKLETPPVMWFGIIPTVHLTRLEDVEYVAKQCVDRNTYGLVEYTIGDGIVAQNHERWKMTRRLLAPAFGPTMLTQYLKVFDEQGKILVNVLKEKAVNEERFDLGPFLLNAHIDVISENTIGIQPGCQKNEGNEYSTAVMRILLATVNRVVNPLLYPDFAFKVYCHFTGLSRQIKTVQQYPIKPLEEALENMDRERTSSSSEHNTPNRMIDILLAHHLINPSNMTKEQMIKEMNHITVTGSEAVTITVGLLMLMYGMHQEEQEMAYREIISVIRDDRPITMDDLNQLVYFEQTLKETLRLFSVAPLSYRSMQRSLTLPYGEKIPNHVEVFLHYKSIHENPSYYPNPQKWNPENFCEEAVKARPQNSFVPFGLGPRNCIGYKYAMLSMKVQASHLLRKYHVSTDTKLEDIVLHQDILRRSRDGYPLRLRVRES